MLLNIEAKSRRFPPSSVAASLKGDIEQHVTEGRSAVRGPHYWHMSGSVSRSVSRPRWPCCIQVWQSERSTSEMPPNCHTAPHRRSSTTSEVFSEAEETRNRGSSIIRSETPYRFISGGILMHSSGRSELADRSVQTFRCQIMGAASWCEGYSSLNMDFTVRGWSSRPRRTLRVEGRMGAPRWYRWYDLTSAVARLM
jgi:hypothetical protein